ncbi:translin, putative [Eimeria tenella]|uniref:Translin, putative n=1 Tax=Eimeria tenella TaxID=5802 RepID=U6KY83_EIMTE|nr:translin, putative [Eimeria tenella]CDJ41304.1 translin, putative [Eimeria tenella]|eukprot:XP_013232054.1 translin, putative [Eimeria tenella]
MAAENAHGVDPTDFREIIEEYAREDAMREELIKKSREVIKLSKQAIFALHRRDTPEAQSHLQMAQKVFNENIWPITEEHPALRLAGAAGGGVLVPAGMLTGAVEEYAEARIFLHFLLHKSLLTRKEIKEIKEIRVEEYLGGLMDCTGELNRFAVLRATEGHRAAVQECAAFVAAVHEQMLLLDLRNLPLRRKYDALKYSQKRLEALVYELALASRIAGLKLASMLVEPEPETHAEQARDA